ncbi:MDR family MFS transporter [Brevirhabdus sp.]|uniref:MDR family MFS transporter n=1 Tax=Brevirhabdus sp. TaxID=2004514 RepID=UPI00405879D3
MQSSTQPAPRQPSVRLVLSSVATVLFLASLGQTIVSTALPTIVGDLDGLDHITWVITAYLLASTVSAPICGKLGDMFGRKIVLQSGIAVFLAGSVLAGLAGDMAVIVAGRAVQGLGAGGLIVVCMAVVADVLPARQRGRAQGLLGGVFGISTIVGPLIGGFIVQQLSWHWIFFVNLPIGLLALLVLGYALEPRRDQKRHSIDYMGAVLLTAFLSSAVMLSSVGGTVFDWASAPVLALIGLSLASAAGFALVESRAAEPILPLSLFANNTFLVVNTVGFMVGTAMFGAITFLPLYLQVVKAVSPATSGLFLLPMMVGLIGGSFMAGRHMTRTGRYKLLPILSTGVLALGMLALSTLSAATALWQVSAYLLVVGLGIGPVLSVGVAAIQNAVPVENLGVGTASANMFRLIGGSLGTAVFGAMFSAGMGARMTGALPEGVTGGLGSLDVRALAQLPASARQPVLDAFSGALHPIFVTAAVLAATGCLVSTLLRELPLSTVLRPRAELEPQT